MNISDYVESDLGTAAYLIVCGHRLIGLADIGRGPIRFSGAAAKGAPSRRRTDGEVGRRTREEQGGIPQS